MGGMGESWLDETDGGQGRASFILLPNSKINVSRGDSMQIANSHCRNFTRGIIVLFPFPTLRRPRS